MSQDIEAMRALYADHAYGLWRYTYGLVHDSGRAEDIVQETLLRAWQHPEVLGQSHASLRAWLFTVARNLAIDDHRSARNRREVRTETPPDRATGDPSDRVLDASLIADALTRLSDDHRQVIVRAYYSGLSTRQIAGELSIPEGTVKSRMHHGMHALRGLLTDKGVAR